MIVTDEMVRQWCRTFGQTYANVLHRQRPRPGDKWHLDAVFISSNGRQYYLWRAVDQAGNVLNILVQSRRDKRTATRFFRTLLKGQASISRVVITDKRASYGAAKREVLPSVGHRQHKGLKNRVEHAHQQTRERERRMRRFTSPGHAQRFLAACSPSASPFRPRRHRLTTAPYHGPATNASPVGGPSPACRPWPEHAVPWLRPPLITSVTSWSTTVSSS